MLLLCFKENQSRVFGLGGLLFCFVSFFNSDFCIRRFLSWASQPSHEKCSVRGRSNLLHWEAWKHMNLTQLLEGMPQHPRSQICISQRGSTPGTLLLFSPLWRKRLLRAQRLPHVCPPSQRLLPSCFKWSLVCTISRPSLNKLVSTLKPGSSWFL